MLILPLLVSADSFTSVIKCFVHKKMYTKKPQAVFKFAYYFYSGHFLADLTSIKVLRLHAVWSFTENIV